MNVKRFVPFIVLACAVPAFAQSQSQLQPQSQLLCRDLKESGGFIYQGETVINGQACRQVAYTPVQQQAVSAPSPPASADPARVPVASVPVAAAPVPNPTAPVSVTSVPAEAGTVAANPAPTANVAPINVPPKDGKIRLYVTDEPKDESIFLAAHRSGWHVDGQSSGEISGSFVNGTGSVSGSSSGYVHGSGGSAGAAYGYSEKGADPRTVEVEADIYQACPSIVVTNDPARGDYALLFRRQGGKRSQMFIFGGLTGLALSAGAKVDGASVFDRNGDLVFATRQRTVEKAIKEVCGHLK
jgi:hypothetical protein